MKNKFKNNLKSAVEFHKVGLKKQTVNEVSDL